MSRRRDRRYGRGKRLGKPRLVLVFGEDPNDTNSIRALFESICPDFPGSVETRRKPIVLDAGAESGKRAKNAQRIAAVVRAERVHHEVVCVFVHAVEPADQVLASDIEHTFSREGVAVHAITPAWELESWWLAFPRAVKAVVPSWREPRKYVGRNVQVVKDAKEELRRLVAGANDRRQYVESDSVLIAKMIGQLGIARVPEASATAYDRFVETVDSCCAAAKK